MVQKVDAISPGQSKDEEVRILIVGDPRVGKTSLVHSLVNDEFDQNLPAKMADIAIPGEATPENIPIFISDYSEQEQSDSELSAAISNANVICVVYVAGDLEGLEHVKNYWLPMIRKSQVDCDEGSFKPVILVANKIDLVEDGIQLDRILAIIQEFVDIEAFIEVSAAEQKNVVELFSAAQKAVTYPLAPLFDPRKRILTRKCRRALIEIFKSCDYDQDGLLDDHELNLFQEDCFGTPLQKDSLDDLKMIIKQSTIDGIFNESLTQAGFLFIHALSIEKGRHDFTWQVLKRFGYDKHVNHVNNKEISQVATDLDDYDHQSLLSSSENSNGESWSNYERSEADSLNFHRDSSHNWFSEHANLIKTGVGVTLVTILSMVAVRYVIQGRTRNAP